MFHYESESFTQFQASGDCCSAEFIYQPVYDAKSQYDDCRMAIRQKWCCIHYLGQRKGRQTLSQGWDGKIKGEDAAVGAYVWFISVQYTDNSSKNLHGTALLLR